MTVRELYDALLQSKDQTIKALQQRNAAWSALVELTNAFGSETLEVFHVRAKEALAQAKRVDSALRNGEVPAAADEGGDAAA